MAVKIVTDSTSDIPEAVAKELGITIVPMMVIFGHESFRDRVDISTDEFYRRLAQDNISPTTTQPPSSVYADAYEKLLKEHDEILTIVNSSKLSGVYLSATNAIGMVEGRGKIEVIDSRLVAMSLGLIVIWAAKLAQQKDLTLKQLAEMVKTKLPASNIIMAFDSLKNLAKGGRVGKAQGLVGSMLAVKPILTLKDGEIVPLTRVRSMPAAIDYIYEYVAAIKSLKYLAVEYATTQNAADVLTARLGAIFPKENIYRSTVSPVLGTYASPSALAVSYIAGE